jgi:flagellar hook-associated protein 1 FlgK
LGGNPIGTTFRPTIFGLQIGKHGLQTAQYGLDVTGHNIANEKTAGFTRQRVVQTAELQSRGFGRTLPAVQLRVGIGSRVLIHDQIRSAFLDRRFRTENTTNSYWQSRTQEMRYLESFFDSINPETNINFTLSRFF